MRVLIAGCGYVGTALGLELAARGDEPFGLRRDPSGLPDDIVPVAADLTEAASLRDLPEVDAVVITASADGRDPERYRAAYVEAPATLLRVLSDRGDELDTVLFASSSAVYGQEDGEWVDESSPADPASETGAILLEAEQTVLGGPYPATVLRLTGIYGPGRTRLVERVRSGEARCPAQPVYTNRIHRDDCAGALAHLLALVERAELYLGVDHDPADRCDVYRWLAERLDAPTPEVDPDAAARRGNKRCSNERLVSSGYRIRYPSFRDGYGAMLDGGTS